MPGAPRAKSRSRHRRSRTQEIRVRSKSVDQFLYQSNSRSRNNLSFLSQLPPQDPQIAAREAKRDVLTEQLIANEKKFSKKILKIVKEVVRPTVFLMQSTVMERLPLKAIEFLQRLEQISLVNLNFLQELEHRVKKNRPIGEVLLMLRVSSEIYKRHLKESEICRKIMGDKRWTNWFSRQHKAMSTSMKDWLTLPASRLEEYQDLLIALLALATRSLFTPLYVQLNKFYKTSEWKAILHPTWLHCISARKPSRRCYQ